MCVLVVHVCVMYVCVKSCVVVSGKLLFSEPIMYQYVHRSMESMQCMNLSCFHCFAVVNCSCFWLELLAEISIFIYLWVPYVVLLHYNSES